VINAQLNVAAPRSLPDRLAGWQRRRMFERFLAVMQPQPGDSLVDVGATSDTTLDHSNYAVAWWPHARDGVTAVGIDDASHLERQYPGVTFRRANGLDLPFADNSFDFAHSSAVIEHVGSRANQARLISELARVSRRGFFVTTPNRWFPIEFHSVLPLIHWLPQAGFHAALKASGRGALADENILNLMGPRELRNAARDAGVSDFTVEALGLLGWPANLLLHARAR
jgi:ubiquinone/menaquinone biosynthesis C-methylase UbiE